MLTITNYDKLRSRDINCIIIQYLIPTESSWFIFSWEHINVSKINIFLYSYQMYFRESYLEEISSMLTPVGVGAWSCTVEACIES